MDLYDSCLFMELKEVVGLDPTFYEDISKQHTTYTTSSVDTSNNNDGLFDKEHFMEMAHCDHPLLPANDGELEGLMAENNQLLDQLMAANGLDLSAESIDLSDIDELAFGAKSVDLTALTGDTYLFGQPEQDLLSDLHSMAQSSSLDDHPFPDSPSSTISTLPSEPSSPMDISALQMQVEQHEAFDFTSAEFPQETELTSLLESLADSTSADIYSDTVSGNDTSFLSSTDEAYSSAACSPTSTYSPSVSSQISDFGAIQTKPKRKKKTTPYSKLPAGRKERKKQQNKEAAIRYREKKRTEAKTVQSEEEQLLQRNKKLKSDVLNLEREILCMKELLSDVFNIHSY